ncbi:MAG TPA: IS481 family transposase, partial [Candidatus Krumholzibacteria bacterium]
MFRPWKRWRKALHEQAAPTPPKRSQPEDGGEDGGGPALAGTPKDEPPSSGSGGKTFSRRTPEQRADLLSLFARSPLDLEEFCAAHEIKPTTFKVWLRGAKKRVDPRFSRRFTPEQRREAVEAFLKSGRTRADFVRLWGCSPSSLDKWLARYREEGPQGLETRVRKPGRKRRHPKRLSDKVRQLILDVRAEHEDFGAQRVSDHLSRFHGIKVSSSAVRKILRENGVSGQPSPQRRSRPKSHLPRRFERARPGDLWQTDITSFVLRRHGRRVYLTVFLDDHSRYIVAWALATHQRSVLVIEPLLEGIARFGKPNEVLADQGRQYFAWRGKSAFQKLLAKEGIQHVVSRAHHPQTLGKCERLWKTVGDEFWDRAKPEDLDDARRRLGHWIRHYNHFRPHQGIGGLVPADRFFDAESQLRASLEKELSENELRLALDEPPRRPVYLVGQIGDERISLHGERGHLVIDTPD